MSPKVFITGVTGFIGGDVLHGLTQTLTASSIIALVRNKSQAAVVTGRFPTVIPLIADLDSSVEIQQAASTADVVLHLASSSHVPSAKAIAEGLAKSERKSPTWIQISGASFLAGAEMKAKSFGQPGTKIYNDLDQIHEIHEILAASPQRAVDHIIRGVHATNPRVRTAMVYGPLIYGQGRGPVNQRSIQIPDLAKATLQHGHGLHLGRGLNTWSTIHVSDLTALFLRLVVESTRQVNPELWNENGIFFAESGKMSFGDIGKGIATFAHSQGFIRTPEAVEIDAAAADRLTPHGSAIWGTNAQYQAIRAREILGWRPQGPSSLEGEIERVVLAEASRNFSRPAQKLA
ncbi:NAD(P)-binding protein [Aspergillus fijiensis CBS 313.89]|uniref:NAD(P)-binding protein n=1 Tax=Aspergillus fijiensis CBS 313.89 TaxID=1448319 RepID=A0A8G1VTJ4_9EURO|nr:NAD(P)-binding protein [Aspergillus fijiensis CBS 313.89]RAK72152.1 NAD(P)-binding protein [Aspergillus fijiensis CBS 313.89]